jgi:probable F420-dependent oxidoreductase
MTSRPLRLGLALFGHASTAEMTEQARRAEAIGFDVVLLPDHLGQTAPLPPLVAIAAAAPSVRVSNLVLNAAFYRPALLARDLASVDDATGGRLIVALGAGYVEEEFTAAGLAFPGPGARLGLLTEHVTTIRALLSDPDYIPRPVQAPPPIMIAGGGDKLLKLAAHRADIVAIASRGTDADLAERVGYVKANAGQRLDEIELAFSFFQVSLDGPTDLAMLHRWAPAGTEADLRRLATVLDGPVSAASERIHRFRDELGITYFTLNHTPGASWESLGKLVAAVK